MQALLILLLIIFLTDDLNAQSVLSGGLWGGVNFSRQATYHRPDDIFQTQEPEIGLEGITTLSGGIDIGFQLLTKLQLSLGFVYVTKGIEIRRDIPFPPEQEERTYREYASTKLSYVEVPLLFKYTLADYPVRPYVMLGPTLDILAHGEHRYISDEESFTYEIQPEDNLGILGGIGAAYPISERLTLHSELSYTYGLSETPSVARGDAYTRDIRAMVGVRLNPQSR